MSHTVEAWEGHAGLRGAADAWREVLASTDANPFFNDPGWAIDYAEAWLDSADVFGWTLRDADGRAVAVLPFRVEPSRGTFALRRALLVSDGTYDSDYLELPIRRGEEAAVLQRMIDLLRGRRGVDAMVLSPIPPSSPLLEPLRAELARRHLPARESQVGCCVAQLPDDFAEYVKGLKSRMRSKVRSSMRKAEELGATFHWCDDAATLDEHLERFYELHAMRWDGEGSFVDERRKRFFHALAHRFLEEGTLRFSRLDLDGVPIAYQFGAVTAGAYYQLQEGYHTDHAKIRIGTALRGLSIERLIDEGIHTYDYMAGVSRHKTDWGADVVDCVTLAFALPRVRARIAYGARALVDRWK